MNIKCSCISIVFLIGFSCKTIKNKPNAIHKIKIEWVENLEGDFSFTKKWSYAEGIYKNEFGQLSCDGFCPEESYQMKDEQGKIFKDSLQAFYNIIDTTHIAHSLYSENRMYEYSGTNFIEFAPQENGMIKGASTNNASTHSSLVVELQNDLCTAYVLFNSIRNLGYNQFPLKNGTIKIKASCQHDV